MDVILMPYDADIIENIAHAICCMIVMIQILLGLLL